MATTRALSDIYSKMHVHRLAGFFRDFRDALNGEARSNSGRVGILSEAYSHDPFATRVALVMALASLAGILIKLLPGPHQMNWEIIAFALPEGGVSDPISTPQGTAIIRVAAKEGVTDAQVATGMDQMRDELVNQW